MSSDPHHHHRWETALDRLERDATDAERMLADADTPPTGSWDEPDLTGPIPADLVDRAVALRARQERIRAELVTALDATRRQHRFADRVDRATGRGDGPVYLDLDA
jgi:hypothetical protein